MNKDGFQGAELLLARIRNCFFQDRFNFAVEIRQHFVLLFDEFRCQTPEFLHSARDLCTFLKKGTASLQISPQIFVRVESHIVTKVSDDLNVRLNFLPYVANLGFFLWVQNDPYIKYIERRDGDQ